MVELREVATDASALAKVLARANRLPADFPVEQLQELLVDLQSLPIGTAEGCRKPLEYARARLPAIRRQFIRPEEQSSLSRADANAPPLLTRGMTVDLRIGAVVNSVTTALDEYRALASVQDDDVADTAPSVEIDATAPDAFHAMATAQNAEQALDAHVDEVERIAEPHSITADNLKRQMHDARGLLSIARIELRMPSFVPIWYRNMIDTISDYPGILRGTSKAMQMGIDVARPLIAAWHHFEHQFSNLVLDSIERAATDLSAVAQKWEAQNSKRQTKPIATSVEPPPDFALDKARAMILRGETLPAVWRPWITDLVFDGESLDNLSPLAGLTALQSLNLANTPVSSVMPLAGLTALQNLNLANTRVSNMAPLAGLSALQSLNLTGTPVNNVAPLAGLTGLQNLDLSSTRVSNVAPLAGLTGLQNLNLDNTRVSSLAPLAGLTNLQNLTLGNTPATDVAPLAGLTGLYNLDLTGTPVSDVAPLAGLTALRTLDLMDTPVSNVVPLAGLTALRNLSLANTAVSNVSPLAALTALQNLDLRRTRVSDGTPLAGLTALRNLDLTDSLVNSVTPLAGLTILENLGLGGTRVSDLGPLTHLTALQNIYLDRTQVGNEEPLAHIQNLKIRIRN
jgi:hypothetical protein